MPIPASSSSTDDSVSTDDLYETLIARAEAKFANESEDHIEDSITERPEDNETPKDAQEVDATNEDLNEEATEEEAEADGEEDTEGTDDSVDTDETTDGEEDSEEAEKVEEQVEIPENFSEEDKETLKSLPVEAQKQVLKYHNDFKAAFTRKTQELAQERKEVETLKVQSTQGNQELLQKIDILQRAIQQNQPQEPDVALLDVNPNEYHRQKALFDKHVKQMQALSTEQEKAATELAEKQKEYIVSTATEAFEQARKNIPGWQDLEVAKKEGTAIVDYCRENGASDEDLVSVAMNPTYQAIVWKSMQFDNIQKQKATVQKKVAGKPPVRNMKSGKPSQSGNKNKPSKAQQVFNKSGSVESLEDVLLERAIKKFS